MGRCSVEDAGSQVKNVSSRYSAVDYHGSRVMGFNNIELISDRPLELNLREIRECIRLFPDRAMIVSLMADNDRESWHELIRKVEDTGAHGLELNFGCPHGMTERGMGATVGQDPEIARLVVEWVMEAATDPGDHQIDAQCAFGCADGTGRRRGGQPGLIADQYDPVRDRGRPGYVCAKPECRRGGPRLAAIADRPLSRSR